MDLCPLEEAYNIPKYFNENEEIFSNSNSNINNYMKDDMYSCISFLNHYKTCIDCKKFVHDFNNNNPIKENMDNIQSKQVKYVKKDDFICLENILIIMSIIALLWIVLMKPKVQL